MANDRSSTATRHSASPPPSTGPLGFAVRATLRSPRRAAAIPELRIYRMGPYGRLVGQAVEPLATNSRDAAGRHALVAGRLRQRRSGGTRVNEWTRVNGKITGPGVTVRRTVAIAVNGRIAGLAIVDELSQYHALLAPTLFASGHNDVAAYLVTGRPSAPRLVAVQLATGPATATAPRS